MFLAIRWGYSGFQVRKGVNREPLKQNTLLNIVVGEEGVLGVSPPPPTTKPI